MSDTHAQTVTYVRETMLPPQDPPMAETGAMKWVRENLFSDWLNSLLTLGAIYVIWLVVSGLVPWLWHSVWTAGSLAECREVLAVHYPNAEHGGACGAVIVERWKQLLFGFYDVQFYWRPITAFLLLFVAVAPILFANRVPEKLIWFTGIYPFIAVWLLWGGAFWVPALQIVGFIIAFFAFRAVSSKLGVATGIGGALVALGIYWFMVMPVIELAINKTVAISRWDSITAEATQTVEVIPAQIAEIEEQVAAADERIKELEGRKAEALAAILAAREAGNEPTDAQVDEFDALMKSLMAARVGKSDLSVEGYQLNEQRTLASTQLSQIQSIPAWEAEIPAAEARADELYDALPAELRGLKSINQADQGTPSQEVLALRLVLDAEAQAATARAALPEELRELKTPDDAPAGTEVEALDTLEAVIDQEKAAAVARSELPESVRALASLNEVDQGTPQDQLNALSAYLSAKEKVTTLEINIRDAYANLGRIGINPENSRDFGGFMLALIIGASGIVLSLPLGILLALGRQSNLPVVRGICVTFIEVIRGVPLIVWLFTASLLLKYFLPPGSNLDLVLRVIILVTFFSAAYIAEVIRGGLAALPKGQYEAADALGLDYWKSMRLIVLPQALKISIPGIVNTFIGLFKDTTLVGIIGLFDPLALANAIRAST